MRTFEIKDPYSQVEVSNENPYESIFMLIEDSK